MSSLYSMKLGIKFVICSLLYINFWRYMQGLDQKVIVFKYKKKKKYRRNIGHRQVTSCFFCNVIFVCINIFRLSKFFGAQIDFTLTYHMAFLATFLLLSML